MIVILKKTAERQQVELFDSWLHSMGLETHKSIGANHTIVGLVGDTSRVDIESILALDIVETVKRIQEPYKNANRKFHEEDTVITLSNGAKIGGGHFLVERPHGELAAQVIVDRLGIVGLCGLIEVVVRREIACLKPVVRYFVRIPVVGFLHFLRAFRESRPVVGGHGRLFFFGYAAGGFECRILGYFHFDGLLEFGRGKLQQLHEAELLLCKPHCCAQVCVEVLALAHVVWITRPAERPGCRKSAAVPQAECEVTIFLSYFIENA